MTTPVPPPGFPGRPFFDAVYQGRAPWDVGAPQPDLLDAITGWPPTGRVLDLGCGTGDLAIGLAERGHEVLGVDFAPAAIEEARRRVAAALPPDRRHAVQLLTGDAMRVSDFTGRISDAVDSGFYHLFEAEGREELARELASALPPGGRYYMLGFAVALPSPDVPRQVTEDELRSRFAPEHGWTIRALRPAGFATQGFDTIPAVLLCAERSGG